MTRVLVAIGSRANWGSGAAVCRAIDAHPDLSLTVLAYASALLDRYGAVVDAIPYETIRMPSLVEGGEPRHMAQTSGLVLQGAANILATEAADVVYVVGDRYEVLPVAYAAVLTNRVVAHQMGGELSGTVDESIRHALTKLSHLHFVATRMAAERVVQMGEARERVHVTGCPRLDLALPFRGLQRDGSILVQMHPVTTEWEQAGEHAAAVMEGVAKIARGRTVHVWWPNADAGTELMVRAMRKLSTPYLTHRTLPPDRFYKLLATCGVLVGNSSAGIREGGFLGTPVVNVGSRQSWRERSANVLDCSPTADHVAAAIEHQLRCTYEPTTLYGDGAAAPRIAEALAAPLPRAQKEWAA